jgi:hypothetical protein
MASKKITKKELKELNDFISEIRSRQLSLGGIEVQKHQLLHEVAIHQGNLTEYQKKLESKYGNVTINTDTGEIKSNKNEVN